MSNTQNTELFEEAKFYAEYFEGTIIQEAIEDAIKTNDLKLLQQHLKDARETAHFIEYQPEGKNDGK